MTDRHAFNETETKTKIVQWRHDSDGNEAQEEISGGGGGGGKKKLGKGALEGFKIKRGG
jgi:hypothetical protein